MPINMNCSKCGQIEKLKESIDVAQNNTPMIRGSCPTCGKWIMWVPYKESYLVKDLLVKEFQRICSEANNG